MQTKLNERDYWLVGSILAVEHERMGHGLIDFIFSKIISVLEWYSYYLPLDHGSTRSSRHAVHCKQRMALVCGIGCTFGIDEQLHHCHLFLKLTTPYRMREKSESVFHFF